MEPETAHATARGPGVSGLVSATRGAARSVLATGCAHKPGGGSPADGRSTDHASYSRPGAEARSGTHVREELEKLGKRRGDSAGGACASRQMRRGRERTVLSEEGFRSTDEQRH